MEGKQRLYYALGQLAYAVAMADGKVQQSERDKMHELITQAMRKEDFDYDFAETIFQILDHDRVDSERSYEWAMDEIKACQDLMTHELKEKFLRVIKAIGDAYPNGTEAELAYIQKATKDLKEIWFQLSKQ